MRLPTIVLATALMASAAFADDETSLQGDPAAGEEQFSRQCTACHVVQNANGEVLAGRNAKTGPNLFGLSGRAIGSAEGFRYSDSIVDVGERGDVWTEEAFVAYVQNPTDWLRATLDDRRARSKMAYQMRDESQAYDIYAYLATLN